MWFKINLRSDGRIYMWNIYDKFYEDIDVQSRGLDKTSNSKVQNGWICKVSLEIEMRLIP